MKSEVKKCSKRCCGKKARRNGLCNTHSLREWVKKNPIKDKFNKLKGSAKRRNIEFNLSLAEFEKFCEETKYHLLSGKTKGKLSVDRIRRSEGYCYSNLQVLTNEENIFKFNYLERHIKDIDPELVKQFEEQNPCHSEDLKKFKQQFDEPLPY